MVHGAWGAVGTRKVCYKKSVDLKTVQGNRESVIRITKSDSGIDKARLIASAKTCYLNDMAAVNGFCCFE